MANIDTHEDSRVYIPTDTLMSEICNEAYITAVSLAENKYTLLHATNVRLLTAAKAHITDTESLARANRTIAHLNQLIHEGEPT